MIGLFSARFGQAHLDIFLPSRVFKNAKKLSFIVEVFFKLSLENFVGFLCKL